MTTLKSAFTGDAALCLCVALLATGFAVLPRPARADNPFCKATAFMTPWNVGVDAPLLGSASADYALWLNVAGTQSAAARVTIVSDKDAYSVNVPLSKVFPREKDDAQSAPYLVRFDKAVNAGYAYVDGVSVDGEAMADCPTFVTPVQPYRNPNPPHIERVALPLKPAFLQALPPLACGAVYKDAEFKRQMHPSTVSHFGGKPLETVILVYLDSTGRVLKESFQVKSGIEGWDDQVFSDAQTDIYTPATFLCSPVVSLYYFRERYEP